MTPDTESGGSQPHLFETSAGQLMVKVSNNPQGSRVLVNELVGGACLDWLGVDHPVGRVVQVPQHVIDDSPGAQFNDGPPLAAGLAFGSEYWQSDAQGTVDPKLLVNNDDIAGTMVLDTWIKNHDGRQYRVRAATEPGKYQFIPLDQGHLFGSPDWTAASLSADRAISVVSPVKPVEAATVRPFVTRLRSFSAADAEAIANEVPDAWATEEERAALCSYLTERAVAAASELENQYPFGDGDE
jgi:hypothetical protein